VNVGFMQVLDPRHVRLRVYERGTGETLACGSGACAAVVAGRLQHRLESTVEVAVRGGILRIEWEGEGRPVYMTGPAETAFTGEIEL
jgi:diaminopimelate epimerase